MTAVRLHVLDPVESGAAASPPELAVNRLRFSIAPPVGDLEKGARATMPKFVASIVAGLAGGLVFGLMMHMMVAPTPDGGRIPMMAMIGQIIGSPSVTVGWIYHLFNSAVIGAMFGWLLGNQVRDFGSGLGWGAAYGLGWWVLGGLVLMPVLLGMAAFAPLTVPNMRGVAMGSLIGHLLYGLTLGGVFVAARRAIRVPVV
jgi:hypothetical protein